MIPILLLFLPVTSPAPATPPVHFSGDLFEAYRKEGKAILKGNAWVKQGDTLLKADFIEVLYEKDGKTAREFRAEGNVNLLEPGRKARSRKAFFYPQENLLILEGDPQVWEGEDELRGERILLYRDPERVIVEKAKGKVSPESLKGFSTPVTPKAP